jgi:NADH dehydrogenase (ubiquinone) 1 alpha subcomplex subunit 6
VDLYKLDIPASMLKHRIRLEFEKNRHLKDLSVINILLFKGRTEYEETMNLWKQKSHLMRWFDRREESKGFLDDFYKN